MSRRILNLHCFGALFVNDLAITSDVELMKFSRVILCMVTTTKILKNIFHTKKFYEICVIYLRNVKKVYFFFFFF